MRAAVRHRLRRARRGLAAVLLAGAAGCSVLPLDKPPPRLFVLTPKSTYPADLPKVDWQLSVDTPIAEAGLNTSRIAVMRQPYSMEYYERANWIDTAPRMVHKLLVESFENSGRIVGVGRQSATLRADYGLITELREFQAEYFHDPSVVHVRINAKLVKLPQRTIVSSVSADHAVALAGGGIEDIVRAFDAALGKALKEVVTGTLRAVPPAAEDRRAGR